MLAIELKTAFCSVQKGQLWRLPHAIGGPKDGWILTDALKLGALPDLPATTKRFVLVCAHAAPQAGDWGVLADGLSARAPGLPVRLVRRDELGAGVAAVGWLEVGPSSPVALTSGAQNQIGGPANPVSHPPGVSIRV